MNSIIAKYLADGYCIQCSSREEIKICKNSAVELLGWSRSSGENMGYPFVGDDGNCVAVGYRKPPDRTIAFHELLVPDDEDMGDMSALL